MKKLFLHLYLYGVFGSFVRLFKCLKENGVSYTLKQFFKAISKEKNDIVLADVEEASKAHKIQGIEPRPSGLRKFPADALETIIDLRLKHQKLKGIFVQAPVIDWEVPLFQRPQHLAIAMAKRGYLVFYCTSNTYDVVKGFIEVYPNVFVTDDIDLCLKLENAVVSIYSTSSHYSLPQLQLIRKKNKLLYEYIDHIDPKISGGFTENLIEQFNFISNDTFDFAAYSSKQLFEDLKNKIDPAKMVYIPNGVELEHFESTIAFAETLTVPEDLSKIIEQNRPIVGYYGALAPWLWYDMLKETMKLLPEFNFVFIGPDYFGGVKKLPQLPNCHYLGIVDYKILPLYAIHFHVSIIPFAPGPIAQTTSPLKLFEYFALKKPVVVTKDLTECVAFKEVLSASNAKEFAEKIQEAYRQKDDRIFTDRLREIALENTWDKRAASLDHFIKSRASM